MGEALIELEQILRSMPEKFTSQESNVLMSCKSKAVRDFTIGAGAAGVVTWFATQRLGYLFRNNLSGGAALLGGFWQFGRSLDSCVEHILGLDGSRMQKELANIMLRKHGDDPWIMQLISKHFYSEKVYDDSSSDQPKLRWRYRNFFGDTVTPSQERHDGDSYGDSDSSQTDVKKTGPEPKLTSINAGPDAMADPFDCVFGLPARVEEISRTDSSGASHKRRNRSHKRSYRRYRTRHREVSSDLQDA